MIRGMFGTEDMAFFVVRHFTKLLRILWHPRRVSKRYERWARFPVSIVIGRDPFLVVDTGSTPKTEKLAGSIAEANCGLSVPLS